MRSRIQAITIISQRKVFYRHRIPDSSRVRKETVDADILVTSRTGEIMHSIRMSGTSWAGSDKQPPK